jgi:hypothetical protein
VEPAPQRIDKGYLVQNREYHVGSPSHHWQAWIWKHITLLEVAGEWDVREHAYYFKEIWDLFWERRLYYGRVFLVIDANQMDIQNEEFRRYLKLNWIHLLDRQDLCICLVEGNSMKRLIWRSIHQLLDEQERIQIFPCAESALEWICQQAPAIGADRSRP